MAMHQSSCGAYIILSSCCEGRGRCPVSATIFTKWSIVLNSVYLGQASRGKQLYEAASSRLSPFDQRLKNRPRWWSKAAVQRFFFPHSIDEATPCRYMYSTCIVHVWFDHVSPLVSEENRWSSVGGTSKAVAAHPPLLWSKC